MRSTVETIKLDAEGITRASNLARRIFKDEFVDNSREATAAWIVFDSGLLRLRDHFGEETEATVVSRSILGRYRILVKVRGERFDPRDSAETSSWEYAAIEASGMAPGFAYLGGYNIITLTAPRKPLSSLVRIACALVLGIVTSSLGSALLPQETVSMLLESVVQPSFDLLVSMLAGLAGPLVFFSMTWGICGIGNAAVIGRKGAALIKRYLGAVAEASVLATITCALLFGVSSSASSSNGNLFVDVYTMLLGLVPTNALKPFIDGNTPQIILLSAAVGISILVIGEAVNGVRGAIRQMNALVHFLMEQLCRLLPVLIFLMTIAQAWSGAFAKLATSWFPVLVTVLLMLAFSAFDFVTTSMRSKVPFAELVRTCLPAITLGLTTASSSAAMGTEFAICTDKLGMSEGEVSFGIPLASVLCKPTAAIEIVVLLAFVMHTFGGSADLVWHIRLAVIGFLYAIVIPPIPGGMIACFTMMFAELGIPMEGIALVTALDIILDYPSTGFGLGSHMLRLMGASSESDRADVAKEE